MSDEREQPDDRDEAEQGMSDEGRPDEVTIDPPEDEE